jgi:hypothetical protein
MNPFQTYRESQQVIHSGVTITLSGNTIIQQVPSYQIRLNKIIINAITDSPTTKTVSAQTNVGIIILWSGNAYDAIGQWTDTDVSNRVKQLFK